MGKSMHSTENKWDSKQQAFFQIQPKDRYVRNERSLQLIDFICGFHFVALDPI